MDNAKIFYTSVAGINFRCTPEDVGNVMGYVQRDPGNEYNPNAVGVYRINGSLLGYIAEKDLAEFYKFKGEGFDQMAFSGNIKEVVRYGKSFYVGDIAIIRSNDEEELSELINKNFSEDLKLYGKSSQA